MLAGLYLAACLLLPGVIVASTQPRTESSLVRNYGTKLRSTLQQPVTVGHRSTLNNQKHPSNWQPLVPTAPEVLEDKQLLPSSNDGSGSGQSLKRQPQIVEMDTMTAPVHFLFRSYSGPLLFEQVHMPAQVQRTHHTRSEEEAQVLSHQVYKPIIHELHEIIQPFRRITQEIKPIKEEVRTLVLQEDTLPSGTGPLDPTSSQRPISTANGEPLQPLQQQVTEHKVDSTSH